MQSNSFLLTLILAMPLFGALSIGLIKSEKKYFYHWLAAFWSGLTFVLSLILLGRYDMNASGFQFVDLLPWMPQFNIQYQVGVDGLSLPMVLLTSLIVFIAVFVSWPITHRSRLFFYRSADGQLSVGNNKSVGIRWRRPVPALTGTAKA